VEQVEASVWRLGRGNFMISNSSERFAVKAAPIEKESIYFFAELEVNDVDK
jgi:hypothetical protein